MKELHNEPTWTMYAINSDIDMGGILEDISLDIEGCIIILNSLSFESMAQELYNLEYIYVNILF